MITRILNHYIRYNDALTSNYMRGHGNNIGCKKSQIYKLLQKISTYAHLQNNRYCFFNGIPCCLY